MRKVTVWLPVFDGATSAAVALNTTEAELRDSNPYVVIDEISAFPWSSMSRDDMIDVA